MNRVHDYMETYEIEEAFIHALLLRYMGKRAVSRLFVSQLRDDVRPAVRELLKDKHLCRSYINEWNSQKGTK